MDKAKEYRKIGFEEECNGPLIFLLGEELTKSIVIKFHQIFMKVVPW